MHISAMANAYVKDPRTIAKPGAVVRVKVLEVDPKRHRISLTMRLDQALEAPSTQDRGRPGEPGNNQDSARLRLHVRSHRRVDLAEAPPSRAADCDVGHRIGKG